MRYYSLFFLLLISLTTTAQQLTKFRLQGKLAGERKGKYAYLQIFSNPYQKSSFIKAAVINNAFVFTGITKHKEGQNAEARIFISDKPGYTLKNIVTLMKEANYDYRQLVLTNEITIDIDNSVKKATVIGGEENTLYNIFYAVELQAYDADQIRTKKLQEQKKIYANDKLMLEKADAEDMQQLFLIQYEKNVAWMKLVNQYPYSKRALDKLGMLAFGNSKYNLGLTQLVKETWEALPEKVKLSSAGQKIEKDIQDAKANLKLDEGDLIPDHSFAYENNAVVSLSSFKGKYLFLDFWTSWCGPCRQEHYYMKQAYEKYKDKGFAILQVSLDDKKEKWLKALQQDQLPWQNLRNETGWDKELEKIFNFTGVPANFLISPEGKIIARNLRGEGLEKKLASLIQ